MQELLQRCARVEALRVVAVNGNRAILSSYHEREPVLGKVAFTRNQLELRVQQMESALLEGIDNTPHEDIEEKDVPIRLTNEQDVGEVRMGIHGSHAPILLTNIAAQLAGYSPFL